MLTVICVYWKGEYVNRQYSDVWVYRLKTMVERNLQQPHRFICLSNVEVNGVETILLKRNWPGWWSKIELFRSDLPGDRFLYLDLDTLPLYYLDDLVNMKGAFIAISPNISHAKQLKKPGRTPHLASGVMVWDKGYANIIYDLFDKSIIDKLDGDQDWIGKVLVDKKVKFELFPREWIRLLRELDSDPEKLPHECRVICCSPGGWRQDIVVEYKGNQYQWVEKTWKKGVLTI